MEIVTIDEMIRREEAAFRAGESAESLMEAAGRGLAQRILRAYPEHQDNLILVGKGNNGGDALVVARELASAKRTVRVLLATPEEELGALPRRKLAELRAQETTLPIMIWDRENPIRYPTQSGLVIDGLLGVQARGPLRGDLAELVAQVNAARAARFFRTVALDLPTGLAAYAGAAAPEAPDAAIVADLTLAVGYAKEVLTRETLADWVGRIEVVPWSELVVKPVEEPKTSAHQLLVGPELAPLLPRRTALSHKNTYGRLVVVAGGRGFSGAAILCLHGGQAIGAGLLSLITRPEVETVLATSAPPEVMVSAWSGEGENKVLSEASAVVIGPGLGTDATTERLLAAVLQCGCPVVVDADALTVLARRLDLIATARGPIVLTPHPGEMARLIGGKVEKTERERVARQFVGEHGVTLVLKGTRTIVTAPNAPLWLNSTGNPSLSAGGSGDTLGGIMGGLLAQGLKPLEAARLGVWLHGHAADLLLARRGAEEGATATLLSATIGAALVSLRQQTG